MATPLVAGNWKMNTGAHEAAGLAAAIRDGLGAGSGVATVICPPYISLAAVAETVEGSGIAVGAQDGHPGDYGAFTGAVSMAMLAGVCQFVIVGHSERRAMFGDSAGLVAAKVAAARAHGLRPILCVGESLEVRDAGNALEYVSEQLNASLGDAQDIDGIVIGYEPVWAIGTGRSARPDVAGEMAAAIRAVLATRFGAQSAGETPILYGGSVNAENIGPFVDRPDIDGALVGGASLKPDEFVRIIQLTASIRT